MCDRCRKAGRKNVKGKDEAAKALHDQCAYPGTCTCQHKTGDGHLNMNLPEMRPLRADALDENPEDDNGD
jgi:hypothetical protein